VPTRLVHVTIDAADPPRLGRFWAAALGWDVASSEPGETAVDPPGFSYPSPSALPLVFIPVPEPKTAKNRVHLDLATGSVAQQAAELDRLLALGATRTGIGQGDVPWHVLADPEGNEFCLLHPQPVYAQTGLMCGVVIDCADPARMADFWELASGWTRRVDSPEEISLRSPQGVGPCLTLVQVPEAKTVKNRMHVEVSPQPGEDHAAAVEALIAAGASQADVGQGEVPWTVLADPESNEFCVLSPR
jgi:hypothetical protein